jgi:hypothetical protein
MPNFPPGRNRAVCRTAGLEETTQVLLALSELWFQSIMAYVEDDFLIGLTLLYVCIGIGLTDQRIQTYILPRYKECFGIIFMLVVYLKELCPCLLCL